MNRTEVAYRIAKQLGVLEYGARQPPWSYKVAALVEDEEIAYLDGLRDKTPRGAPWTGEIVVLTERRVARATILDPSVPSGSAVACWARRSLTGLHIDGSDQYWDEYETGMPLGSQLRLEYAGGNALSVPLDPALQRPAVTAELLSSLLADLAWLGSGT
jgi:hypothetical protein